MKLPMVALGALALATLGGCSQGYGYGGVDIGYGAPGYNGYDGYGGYGYGYPYYGWYGDYYYPGTGFYVYDSYRRPYRWNYDQQRYWEGRGRQWRGNGRPAYWAGFDRRPGQPVGPGAGRRSRDGGYGGNDWAGRGDSSDALTGGPRSLERGRGRGDRNGGASGSGDGSWAGGGDRSGAGGSWSGGDQRGSGGVTIGGGRRGGDGARSGGGRRGDGGGGRSGGGGGRSSGDGGGRGSGGSWGGGRN